MIFRSKIRHDELGFLFKDGKFVKVLRAGKHYVSHPFKEVRIDRVSTKEVSFSGDSLREILKVDSLEEEAEIVDLSDSQRAILWIDGRFETILNPGLHAIWKANRELRIELIDARSVEFKHPEINVIARASAASEQLQVFVVERHHEGAIYIDGKFDRIVEPGWYAFWRKMSDVKVPVLDMREHTIDVVGQDLMTSDKVTIRINALVTYKVIDTRQAVSAAEDPNQALYRATQMALRGIVSQHELDEFLANKEQIADESLKILRARAAELGLTVVDLGVRDIILPGDMRDLMNRVIEAKKAAEANLIARREETAAMRSQANTAKLLDAHPTLMRLRELEVLEKVASSSNLKVVLGDKDGLSDRLTRLV
jgi:regulator of protease activity HflC (stomatin/prohibitin superfamily)